MADGGKGSRARPLSVPKEVFNKNFEAIFKKEKKMQVKVNEKIGSCGCGRSPTGDCIGWHALLEEDYRIKLAEYETKENLNNQPKGK